MVSQIGDRFTQMAFIELLGKEFFGNFAAFGGIAVVFTLPSIFLGFWTGPFIDKWRKKRILLISDIIRAALVITLPFIHKLTGNLKLMLAVALILYIFGFFFNSARMAFIPLIVEKDKLLQANSANLTLLRAATGIGTLAGGFLVPLIGWQTGFKIDSFTYLISFVLILFIKVDEKTILEHAGEVIGETRKQVAGYFRKLGEGVALMLRTRMMFFVMSSIFILFFVSGISFSVIVPTVQQTLGMGTIGVTVLAAAAAAGMFLGPLFTGLLGSAFRKHRLIMIAFVLIGLLFAFGGASYLFVGVENVLSNSNLKIVITVIMGVVVFFAGILFSAININQDTIIQERTPAASMGSLFAWKELLASLAFLVSALIAGFIADRISFEYVLIAVGVIVALFGIVWIPVIWMNNGKLQFEKKGGNA